VITHYSVLVSGAGLAAIEKEFARVQAADPASLLRAERLHGLSPWAERRQQPEPSETRVRAIVDAMDSRGAWVEDGSIGKADRLVTVLAGKDMVVTLGGKPMPLLENQTLEVFLGEKPPKQRIIKTRTFADNVEVLLAYVGR